MENLYYVGDTATAIKLELHYVSASIRSRLSKSRDLLLLISNWEIPLEIKKRLYFQRVYNFILYENETWPVKQ